MVAALSLGSQHTRGRGRDHPASVWPKPRRLLRGWEHRPCLPCVPGLPPRSRIHRTVGSRRQGALPVSIMRPEHRALASPSSAGVQGCLGLSFHPHTPWRKGVPCSPPHGPFQLHRARSTASRKALETKTTASKVGSQAPGHRAERRERSRGNQHAGQAPLQC